MILLSLLLTVLAFAEPVFTTIFYDDGGTVYVGMKEFDKEKRESSQAQVAYFAYPLGEVSRIPLPEEIANRNIIGILPYKEKLFIITHQNEEKNDGPMIHLYNVQKESWKKLGQAACPAFTKVKLKANSVTFFCEQPAKKGKTKVRAKTISLGKERIYRSGTMRFPEFLLRYRGISLLLEGDAPNWTRMRIKSEEKERFFLANEIFQQK